MLLASKKKKIIFYVLITLFFAVLFFLFKYLFSGHLLLPQAFRIGPVSLRLYGLCIAAAVFAGWLLARRRAARYGLSADQADDFIFWVVIGGFVGARLYHVVSSFGYYFHHPLDSLKVWNGGLSIYGVFFGGVLTIFILYKILNFKFKILNILDWLAPSLLLGQIIGRFGNFFNYELFGYPTGLPWKMFVPPQFRPVTYGTSSYFHPLFLYEVLWNVVVFVFLMFQVKRGKFKNGGIFFFYLLLYNGGRFLLEFLRIDSVFSHGLRVNALVSLALVFVSGAYVFFRRKDVFAP